jgi:hypothetical protein
MAYAAVLELHFALCTLQLLFIFACCLYSLHTHAAFIFGTLTHACRIPAPRFAFMSCALRLSVWPLCVRRSLLCYVFARCAYVLRLCATRSSDSLHMRRSACCARVSHSATGSPTLVMRTECNPPPQCLLLYSTKTASHVHLTRLDGRYSSLQRKERLVAGAVRLDERRAGRNMGSLERRRLGRRTER